MSHEFERYHGTVLRELIVKIGRPLTVSVADDAGRINTFLLDERVMLHIKHSSKRLPPWQFTFTTENIEEIERLRQFGLPIWLALVCGQDGMVAISFEEFRFMNPYDALTTSFIRVDRDRNTMYRVNGTSAKLRTAKPRGIVPLISALESAAGLGA